jgi:hypothetical protein
MTRRSLIPPRLARAVVAWAARACVRDPDLYHPALGKAARAAEHRQWVQDEAAGRAIAAAWPPGAHPDIDTAAWSPGEFAHLGVGIDPEQIEGDRRFLTDWPFCDLDAAAAEAARLIPDPTPGNADTSREAALARVLLAVLLHAADHSFRDTDQVRAWAGDLTPAGLHTVHTCLHDSGGDTWPALAVLTIAQSLPAPTLTRVSDLITTALPAAGATTTGALP